MVTDLGKFGKAIQLLFCDSSSSESCGYIGECMVGTHHKVSYDLLRGGSENPFSFHIWFRGER